MFKMSFGNVKLNYLAKHLGLKKTEIVSFDLPAGWSCPMADICKTKVDRHTGIATKYGRVKCYATKAESLYPNTRNSRWHNMDLIKSLKTTDKIADMLCASLPKKAKIVRIHSSGDFFSVEYFNAWVKTAERNPNITFFAYTKNLPLLSLLKPDNFSLVYSVGGTMDDKFFAMDDKPSACYIEEKEGQYPNIKSVCGSHDTAHEDFFAILNNETFKIPMH